MTRWYGQKMKQWLIQETKQSIFFTHWVQLCTPTVLCFDWSKFKQRYYMMSSSRQIRKAGTLTVSHVILPIAVVSCPSNINVSTSSRMSSRDKALFCRWCPSRRSRNALRRFTPMCWSGWFWVISSSPFFSLSNSALRSWITWNEHKIINK